MNALKQFGLGILWALLFPILLVIYALIGVFGLFNFFYQFVLMIVHFFQGKNLFPPLEEDVKAAEILQKRNHPEEQQPAPAPAPAPAQVYVQQNYYQMPPGYPPGAYPPGAFGPQNPGAVPPPYQGAIPQQNPYPNQNNPANPEGPAPLLGQNPDNGGDEQ